MTEQLDLFVQTAKNDGEVKNEESTLTARQKEVWQGRAALCQFLAPRFL